MLVKLKRVSNIEFLKHGINYIIANFFSKGLVFLMIPIYTRMLTPNEYGIYSIYVSLVSIFNVLVSFNLPGAIKQSYLKRKEEFSEILGTNLIFSFLFIIPISVFYFLFKNKISVFFGVPEKVFSLSIGVCLFLVFYNMYTIYLEADQQSTKFLKILCSNKIMEILMCVTFLFYFSKNKYYAPIYSQIFITALFSLFCIYKLISIAKFKFDFKYIEYSLLYAVPLIPHNLSNFILAQFDRIILNQILGSYSTGLYSFAYNIGMAITVMINSLNSSWVPIFFKNYSENRFEELEKLAKKFFKIIYLFAVVLILFSQEFTVVLSTKTYYESMKLIPIIVLGNIMIFFYVIYANYAFYYHKTYMISLNTFVAGITNIILNYIFIPKYGYIAAAYTTLFSYIILFLLHYINAKYILKAKVMSLIIFKKEVLILILIVTIYFMFMKGTQVSLMLFLLKVFIMIILFFFELKPYFKR